MKDISEERKRQIELELVDMADSLRDLAEETGCSLDLHAYYNELPEKHWIHCSINIFHRKEVEGKKYISNIERYIREDDDADINPIAGLLSEEPTDWTRIKTEEDSE